MKANLFLSVILCEGVHVSGRDLFAVFVRDAGTDRQVGRRRGYEIPYLVARGA